MPRHEDGEAQGSREWFQTSKEALPRAADLVASVMWSASMRGESHIAFGLLSLFNIVVVALGHFTIKGLNWKQADADVNINKVVGP